MALRKRMAQFVSDLLPCNCSNVLLLDRGNGQIGSEDRIEMAMPLERDFSEEVLLGHYHCLHPHQFQHGEEQRDHGTPRPLLLKNAEDENRLVRSGLEELLLHVSNHSGYRDIGSFDFINRPVLSPLQHIAESLDQIE